jgi:hypothetical protein
MDANILKLFQKVNELNSEIHIGEIIVTLPAKYATRSSIILLVSAVYINDSISTLWASSGSLKSQRNFFHCAQIVAEIN